MIAALLGGIIAFLLIGYALDEVLDLMKSGAVSLFLLAVTAGGLLIETLIRKVTQEKNE